MADDPLYPVALLIDELKNADVQHRLESVKRLPTIASALGVERTRNELIPFLMNMIEDEDDVLLSIAEQVGGFLDFVGGAEHVSCLLELLSLLCSVEETVVREKATESLCTLTAKLRADHIQDSVMSVLRQLAKNDFHPARSSACGLFSTVYPRLPPSLRQEAREMFSLLCSDPSPIVRRAAFTNLGKFASVMDLDSVKRDIVPSFRVLSQDEQDSVRLIAVDNFLILAKVVGAEQSAVLIVPIIRSCVSDKSWRVRYLVADRFSDICGAISRDLIHSEMANHFVRLLRDSEPEVRTAATLRIATVCALMSSANVVAVVLPEIGRLSADPSQQVRAALSTVVTALAPLIGRDAAAEHLVPRLLDLLKDEFHEVRLNVISRMSFATEVIGGERLAESLLPAVVRLAEDKQWRVRLAMIENVSSLAKLLGIEKILPSCLSWLGDSVFAVREMAIANIKKLTTQFGSEWAKTSLLPKVFEISKHQNYLHRMTVLFAASALCSVLPRGVVTEVVLPVVVGMANDKVPNVRFNVAKTLAAFVPHLDVAVVRSQVKMCLEKLRSDSDADVKYYAENALLLC